MKKLLSLLLVFIMVFSLIACDKNKGDDDDDDNDGSSSVITPGGNPGDGDGVDKTEGLTLSKAFLEQFKSVASFKIDLDFSMKGDADDWYYTDSSKTEIDNAAGYTEATLDSTMTVGVDANGNICVKYDAIAKDRENPTDEMETEANGTILLIVDNVIYAYDSSYGMYLRTDIVADEKIAQMSQMIVAMLDGVSFSQDETDAVLKELGFIVLKTFDIKNNKGSISFDAKEVIDNLKAYINAIDAENDTLRKLLDDALKLVNKDLTSAALITELEKTANLTVNEAIAEIDKALTAEYNTTLQGIYDTLVNDTRLATILANAEKMFGEGGDFSASEMLTQIKAIKLADLITEAGVGDMKLIDLIMMAIAGNGPEEDVSPLAADSAEEPDVFDEVNAILDLTIAQFEEMAEMPILTLVKTYVNGITVNEFKGNLDINFEGAFQLKTIEGSLKADFKILFPSDVEGKTNRQEGIFNISFKIYDFSKDTLSFSAPTDKPVIYDIFEKAFYSDDMVGAKVVFSISGHYDEETDVIDWYAYMNFIQDNTSFVEITADEIPLESFTGKTITISGDKLSIYIDGESVEFDETQNFTITINPDDRFISSFSYPDIKE